MVDNHQNPLWGKIAAYTEILDADPDSTIFVSLSESYRKLGMLDDAYSVAIKGLVSLPDYGPGHVVLARIKCQQGDMAASEAAFRRALEIDPDSLAALVGFSRLYLLLDNKSSARDLLLTARELSPADSVINKLLLSLPEPEIAEEEYEHVTETDDLSQVVTPDPSTIEPLETATLAELYLKQGMSERGLNIYRNLLMRDPDNLGFRRRIRDLELMSTDSIETPGEDSISGQGDIPGLSTEDVVLASPIEPNEEKLILSPSNGDNSVLDQLNQLLISIRKRRGNV